ncbi:hypothetical protein [Mycobacterium tuberculosis]|uniref:hypothetical protein n=1 Tax=Mycobacterium tuberculosis TaxID=1773 RepID=UPI0005E7B8E2|nr:hypothetical protein [Mycobacterium tuberculosis]CMQ40117.1 integral membrane protein [Mycobacterium tuberculosis]
MPASRLVRQVSAPRNLFGRLVAQGGFYTAGLQLGSGAVVLPVICAHQGLTWAAGLLYPAFCIGAILGNSLSPLILQRAGQLRHLLMAAISATAAALVVCNAAVPWTGVGVAAVFLATTGAGGVVTGVSSVAYTDMISSMLPAVRRGELLLTPGAAGSVLATGVTLVIVPMLAHGNEMARYHDLLWLGAAGLVCSGIAALFVGPMRSVSVTTATRMPLREIYWMGFAIARSQPWFRRYMTTYLLFVPISLGTTFFSLRAAQSNGSLHVLVILSSIGLVVGSMLWRQINRLFGVRGLLLGSALLNAAAALLCMVAESCGQWVHAWAYGTAFLLATVAAQTVVAASISWISVLAPERYRATLICVGSTLAAVEATVLGVALGGIAQKHATIWPVVVVLTLAVIAAVASLRAPTRIGVTADTSPQAATLQAYRPATPNPIHSDERSTPPDHLSVRRGQLRHVWDSRRPAPPLNRPSCRRAARRPAPGKPAAALPQPRHPAVGVREGAPLDAGQRIA